MNFQFFYETVLVTSLLHSQRVPGSTLDQEYRSMVEMRNNILWENLWQTKV
jgi:hypothetical protein